MLEFAEIFNVPDDENDFFGFELDIPMETLSLDDRNENDNMPETSRMAMELEGDNNPSLIEEEEMETESSHKKRRFKTQGTLQLPKKIAISKLLSSDSNKSPLLKGTKNTNGRNADQDTSSESEADEAPDENSNILLKRDQNIKENKAVLAQLLADLESSIPEINIPSSTKRKKASRKRASGEPIQRRTNPTRTARPPENFAVERNLPVPWVDNETYHSLIKNEPKKRKISNTGPLPIVTNEDLEHIAFSHKGKIYDRILGTTCHQCRQKTIDKKTTCHNKDCVGVRGQFCGPCLRNRYGEDVKVALLNPKWLCPPCRGVCNCSYCRKRDGYCATGTLIHLAKLYGYTNVKEYLESMPMYHVNGNE
ncbi:cell division cycle-associated 7-like protein [Notechis scutatus]|uniref:Cell division cycle-associated 7-like protein n=1 Tax=Notechis scutatus TaxID=8663 RepID=A0A6J1US74_9SAUR|nr:cell division cycle-associated 7-like protein [Notechis scutatus]